MVLEPIVGGKYLLRFLLDKTLISILSNLCYEETILCKCMLVGGAKISEDTNYQE